MGLVKYWYQDSEYHNAQRMIYDTGKEMIHCLLVQEPAGIMVSVGSRGIDERGKPLDFIVVKATADADRDMTRAKELVYAAFEFASSRKMLDANIVRVRLSELAE